MIPLGFFTPFQSRVEAGNAIDFVKTEVTLGNPKARCRGVGICNISLVKRGGGVGQPSCEKVPALLSRPAGQLLRLKFYKKYISPCMLRWHFGGGSFVIKDPFRMSAEVAMAIGLMEAVIPEGDYPILEEESFLRIDYLLDASVRTEQMVKKSPGMAFGINSPSDDFRIWPGRPQCLFPGLYFISKWPSFFRAYLSGPEK